MEGLKEKHSRDDGDDDDVSDQRLSAGMEATRDVIDAYKPSMKEKRNMESWTESGRGGGGGEEGGREISEQEM